MTLILHNTLTKKDEQFSPQQGNTVSLYTCGPTVYDYLTIGNWTAFIYWDILVRTLLANNYDIERVMNITDVGHLVSDEDEGEDKLEKGARREGKTAWEVAEFYSEDFLKGVEKLGLLMPQHLVRATDFIPQQLDLIRILKEKGFTYRISDGIYFDTSKFPTYADFAGLDLAGQRAGARVEYNPEKRNHSDFALWKFTPEGEKRDMEWETPADLLETSAHEPLEPKHLQPGTNQTSGLLSDPERSRFAKEGSEQANTTSIMGFPGWHLECSTMAMSILGPTIDIHTGGIDHIPVHHTNEIAQSEAASGKLFAHFWLHNNHLKVEGTKISKSLGNGYTLQDLEKHGFSAIDFRMFVLQGQYSNEGNFTFENLRAAKNRLAHWRNIAALRHQTHSTLQSSGDLRTQNNTVYVNAASQKIIEALNDNLNTPLALAAIDEAFSQLENQAPSAIHQPGLAQLIETIDETLGLQIAISTPDISDGAKQMIFERQRARDEKDWAKSDQLRETLLKQKIAVRDTTHGTIWEYAD